MPLIIPVVALIVAILLPPSLHVPPVEALATLAVAPVHTELAPDMAAGNARMVIA
jgi:hypothetical protein